MFIPLSNYVAFQICYIDPLNTATVFFYPFCFMPTWMVSTSLTDFLRILNLNMTTKIQDHFYQVQRNSGHANKYQHQLIWGFDKYLYNNPQPTTITIIAGIILCKHSQATSQAAGFSGLAQAACLPAIFFLTNKRSKTSKWIYMPTNKHSSISQLKYPAQSYFSRRITWEEEIVFTAGCDAPTEQTLALHNGIEKLRDVNREVYFREMKNCMNI